MPASFCEIGHALFIYGHSLATNDEHFLKRIEKGKVTQLYLLRRTTLQQRIRSTQRTLRVPSPIDAMIRTRAGTKTFDAMVWTLRQVLDNRVGKVQCTNLYVEALLPVSGGTSFECNLT